MADNIIPTQITGGTGPAPTTGNIRAPDYRQYQSAPEVRTDLPNAGFGQRAAALAQTFKDFEGVAGNVYTKVETQAGALAGAASGATGSPEYKQGFARLTAYGTAYNNAATGAYAIEAEAQADSAAARLRVAANKDPGTFATTFTAYRDAVLKNAPPLAVPMLTELYNKHLAQNLAAVAADQLTDQREQQSKTYLTGIATQTSRVATLQGSANPQDQLAAQDEQVKLNLKIEGGVNSGLYSRAEADAMHLNAMRTITEQVFSTQVDNALAHPEQGDVVQLMERFRQSHIDNLSDVAKSAEPGAQPILSQPEFDRLMSEAKQKVQQQRMLDYYAKAEGKTAEQLKYEAGDKDMTGRLLQGTLTVGALAGAVRNGDVTPEVARTLRNQILQGPVARSDPRAMLDAQNDPNHLDWTNDQIAALPDISNPDKIKLGQQFEKERRDWQGTPEAKQGTIAIAAALKIKPGVERAMLSEDQRNAQDAALQEYTARMNAMDPAKRRTSALSTAQDVVHGIQQKNIQSQISQLQSDRQSAATLFGSQWSKEKLDQYLRQKDDAIKALQAQLGK